jgi:hypothetical protein
MKLLVGVIGSFPSTLANTFRTITNAIEFLVERVWAICRNIPHCRGMTTQAFTPVRCGLTQELDPRPAARLRNVCLYRDEYIYVVWTAHLITIGNS